MMPDEAPQKIEMLNPPDPKEFWIVYAHAFDWQVLLHLLVLELDPSKGKEPLDTKIAFTGYSTRDQVPVFYLSRAYFPVEKLAAFIGKEPDQLAGIETLHLREIKNAEGKPAQEGWQKSSVDYWGRA